ncbi:unnamed protein product [Kuraishia capsulata CBS 1993]|uniref:ML-like domain-containing protein n=1 Tax=Kuraishia capsulata CBS 1993 TaxID=1382522 RepID=W6MJD8_9ASCO|nr:uncharacterized protein KUCA_T00000502001 [Kuraishia capsulata CBS 1993]CDK24537.1 unnamed protein product [Kuraishia capsulata CBS 1993]
MRSNLLGLLLLFWASLVHSRKLSASSLVTCMDNSQLIPQYFNVNLDPDSGALRYDLSLTSEISGNIIADVEVYAYGFKIITETVNMCSIGWKQFCPIYPGTIEIDSITYISKSYINMLPGIAYTFPDLDAQVRVIVKNHTGTELACIQAGFSNGKTVSHTAVKWVTACIAGIGLLVSALLSAFGNSNSASHISASAVSLFTYFQSVVIICMLHVQSVPPIASAWAENLAWSMGLIRVTFMQKIFRWYVQATGGSPTQYLSSDTISILVQRSFDQLKYTVKNTFLIGRVANLFPQFFHTILDYDSEYYDDYETPDILNYRAQNKRDVGLNSLQGSSSLKIIRGIDRIGYKAHIEPTSIACTGFTFFVIFGYVVVGFFVTVKTSLALARKMKWVKPERGLEFSKNWKLILKGVLQRYIYIGFTQLTILSLWEFTVNDSPAVIVLAVLFLILCLGVLGWACYRTLQFGRKSIKEFRNPAAILYGDPRVLNRYGWFYTMYSAKKYWFGAVAILHNFLKALFVGLAQGSGMTQALAIFILDLAYTIYVIYERPYLDRPINILSILMVVVMTLNSFFFLFFSNLFGQPPAVAAVMGLVFFILNAIFSLVVLLFIIVYSCIAVFSKNPDARFAPAKDDRTSFQRNFWNKNKTEASQPVPEGAAELFELGAVAKDHQDNWEGEMLRLKELVDEPEKEAGQDQDQPVYLEPGEESFGAKLFHKLSRGKSWKMKKSQADISSTTDSTNEKYDDIEVVEPLSSGKLMRGVSLKNHERTESATPMIGGTQEHSLDDDYAANVSNARPVIPGEVYSSHVPGITSSESYPDSLNSQGSKSKYTYI